MENEGQQSQPIRNIGSVSDNPCFRQPEPRPAACKLNVHVAEAAGSLEYVEDV